MAKMPEKLKIWVETRYGEEKTRDLTKLLEVGDEIGLTTGEVRNRTTTYKVTDLYVNCAHLRREDAILAEKRQEFKEKLEKKEPLDKRRAKSSGLLTSEQVDEILDTREPIDEQTTDPEADELRAEGD